MIERVGLLFDVIVMFGLSFPDGLCFPCDLDVVSLVELLHLICLQLALILASMTCGFPFSGSASEVSVYVLPPGLDFVLYARLD